MRDQLYLVHISIHGLIRGQDLELGRDSDTGGQTKYVVELARELALQEKVSRVDLITRQIFDPKISDDYAQEEEALGNGAFIRRIPAGPRRYLKKESLWPYLDVFVDHALQHFRKVRRMPDLIHAHYADAGYVGRMLASMLGCPFVFTGHSLGRLKRQRLLAQGQTPEAIEKRYNLRQRIEAEELSLDSASLVCTSTSQEVTQQYALYEQYAKDRMRVIPPGVDLSRFSAPDASAGETTIAKKIDRFLTEPEKPLILTLARADERKNLSALVRAYGKCPELQELANLAVLAGNRDEIRALDSGARKVWRKLLETIDDHDLYGKVAIPKTHEPDEVPELYRLAALRKGVFVNPAITENFGLTLIEAAASGLPIVATNDGGPKDIIGNCKNGRLIDPLDEDDIRDALLEVLRDPELWKRQSEQGLSGVAKHYSWGAHAKRYLEETAGLFSESATPNFLVPDSKNVLPVANQLLFCGLFSQNNSEDADAIKQLKERLNAQSPKIAFGICTGRDFEQTQRKIKELGLPRPDIIISQLGGEIRYGAKMIVDENWSKHLNYKWRPDAVHEALKDTPGLSLQEEPFRQHRFKISYNLSPDSSTTLESVSRTLRKAGLQTKVILTEGTLLDVLPLRSGKGNAIRHLAMKWDIAANNILVFARHGNDAGALRGDHLGVLPRDHSEELDPIVDYPYVYVSNHTRYQAVLDGMDHYKFD